MIVRFDGGFWGTETVEGEETVDYVVVVAGWVECYVVFLKIQLVRSLIAKSLDF